ncbi:MAG: hypothetical protein RLZZ126_391 [Pseudomonadota bacterium]|jgi:hypothetical protein
MDHAFASFRDFYPFYLGEHQNLTCRRLHFVGSSTGLVCLGLFAATGQWGYLLLAMVSGYAFAWVGHFFFEKNRPATFSYPVYSFMGDWVMYKDIWLGRVKMF